MSHFWFQRLLDSMDEWVFVYDAEGNMVYANDHVFHQGDSSGEPARPLSSPVDADRLQKQHVKDRIRQVFESATSIQEEYQTDAGHWFEATLTPLANEEQTVEWVVERICDISRRKQDEHALKQSLSKYRALIEQTMDGVYLHDLNGRIVEVNQEAIVQSGFSESELLERSVLDLHPQTSPVNQQREAILKQWRTWKTGETKTLEAEHQRKHGDVFPVEIRAKKVVIDNRDFILSLARDITQRKQMEADLKRSEEKYRALIEQSMDAVYLHDLDGSILEVNREAARQTGYSKTELTARTVFDLHPESSTANPEPSKIKEYWRQWSLGDSHTIETEYRRKDGTVFPVEVRKGKVSFYNQDYILGLVTDITHRKRMEKKIRHMSTHDFLTGLPNRRYFEETIDQLDTPTQLPLSLVMVDVNGLKLANDTYGHATGDEMLKRTAEILKACSRERDIVVRWGGDEFIVLLPGTTLEVTQALCQRLKTRGEKVYVENLPLSLAVGYASKETTEQTLSDVLKMAEDTMYTHKMTESRSSKSETLNTIVGALGEISPETSRHIRDMQEAARGIAEKLALPDVELNRLDILVRLHDIGKINIPSHVLEKADPLSEEEWEMIKKHPVIGYRIALASEEFSHVAQGILAHHEHWDGNGYPRGLRGKDIPLLARIVAIADAYDVMSYGRPYKRAMSEQAIKEEFRRCAGIQFDPDLVEVFLSTFDA